MNRHEDERGIIEDLLVGDDYSVTRVTFEKDAVRGNHFHKKTTQKDYVLSGKIALRMPNFYRVLEAGESYDIEAGVPHAYKALEKSEMVSICRGVRIGENYEKDTFRLETPLIC